jgi:hypothetical protein
MSNLKISYKDFTFVIPAKNEVESINKVLSEIRKISKDCKILICLNDKFDSTYKVVKKKYKVKFLFINSIGIGESIRKGLNNSTTKYTCISMADGSSKISDLFKMYSYLKNNNDLSFIIGSRYEKKSKSYDDNIISYVGNYIFTKMLNFFYTTDISDALYSFVAGKTIKFKKLGLKTNDFTIAIEIPLKIINSKLKYSIISTIEKKRIGGEKKVNYFKDGFLILIYFIKYLINKKI